MKRAILVITAAIGFAFASTASAATCSLTTWTFVGLATCGSGSTGVSFTQGGETITLFPEVVQNGVVQSSTNGPDPLNGLFEVNNTQGNVASGIAPFVASEGSSPFRSQLGIQDYNSNGTPYTSGTRYDNMLYIEVSQTGPGSIAAGTTLSFLMEQGLVADTFNVYTGEFAAGTNPPNLASMTPALTEVAVGATSGGATFPQFKIKTTTTSLNPVEFIAIQADCEYLLLKSIGDTPPSGVPEPRFYGLMPASVLGLAGIYFRNRKTARSNA